MITSAVRKRSALIFVALCLFLILLSSPLNAADRAGSDNAGLADLLRSIGGKVSGFGTLKTGFVQEKDLAMFKNRITIKGRIYLQKKPDKVAWHVDSPMKYSVLMTDTAIRQWDEESRKVQEISLAKNPVFQNVLNQLNVWFSGNFVSLLEDNEVRLVSRQPLVIEFEPTEKNVARKIIKRITVTFRDDEKYLKSIRIEETGKDVTTINFINTDINPQLAPGDFEVDRGG